jgi:hypothetical protein
MITKVAIGVIIFLATMVAIYSLFLLVVGQPWSVAYEDNMRQRVEYVRATQAIVPFLSALMILGGLIIKKRVIAGLGTVILLLFSLLFVFGVGGIILPVAGAMLLLIAIISVIDSSQ